MLMTIVDRQRQHQSFPMVQIVNIIEKPLIGKFKFNLYFFFSYRKKNLKSKKWFHHKENEMFVYWSFFSIFSHSLAYILY